MAEPARPPRGGSAADDATLEARTLALARDLRCLVCQNESLAESRAPLAQDLRTRVRERLSEGATPDQVRDELVARYGDFIRYQPPLDARTLPLWAGPGLLVGGGALTLAWLIRRRGRLADTAFEPSAPAESGWSGETDPGQPDRRMPVTPRP